MAKLALPKALPDQVRAVREALAAGASTPQQNAARFKRRALKAVTEVLATLEVME